MMHRHFSHIQINGKYNSDKRPVLLISNHFSWWDGFFMLYLNNRVFKKKYHVLMLEEQLKPRMFLNKAGAFSVKKGTRSVIESIDYIKNILSSPGNLVLIYPQGVIQSLYKFPFVFEKGIYNIIKNMDPGVRIFFAVALLDYFSQKKPSLNISFKEYARDTGAENIEKAFNDFYSERTNAQKP